MGLTALDVVVLLLVAGTAALGLMRGFVSEALSLMAWIFTVFALRLLHAPVMGALTDIVGTAAGAAVLAFALIVGITYFGGRMAARGIGARTRSSVLGPLDRALGLGFGAVKGLIFASLAFLLIALVTDTVGGGPAHRPGWMTKSRTYPLLNATSASIAEFVDRRRQGLPTFGATDNGSAPANDTGRGDADL
ncbi:MAG: CvpA family protein [Sphingomonas sp.]|jgi:membrane protein required for colicin V production